MQKLNTAPFLHDDHAQDIREHPKASHLTCHRYVAVQQLLQLPNRQLLVAPQAERVLNRGSTPFEDLCPGGAGSCR